MPASCVRGGASSGSCASSVALTDVQRSDELPEVAIPEQKGAVEILAGGLPLLTLKSP
jgi:hypothetical protein